MEKKNLDWGNLGFGYMTTDYRYVANYKDGKWDDGALVTDPTVTLNECAGVFQYSQSCFEGLKAYTTEDGHIVCFRTIFRFSEKIFQICAGYTNHFLIALVDSAGCFAADFSDLP